MRENPFLKPRLSPGITKWNSFLVLFPQIIIRSTEPHTSRRFIDSGAPSSPSLSPNTAISRLSIPERRGKTHFRSLDCPIEKSLHTTGNAVSSSVNLGSGLKYSTPSAPRRPSRTAPSSTSGTTDAQEGSENRVDKQKDLRQSPDKSISHSIFRSSRCAALKSAYLSTSLNLEHRVSQPFSNEFDLNFCI